MMPKVIVLDLDGTLLDSNKRITDRNLQVMRGLKDAGIPMIFATARPPRAVNQLEVDLLSYGSVVYYNGALFQCRTTGREMHYSITKETASSIFDYCLSRDPGAHLSMEVKDEWLTYKALDYREMMRVISNPSIVTMEQLRTYDCTKILISDYEGVEELNRLFGSQVHILCTDSGRLIQIMSRESSKEKAVQYLVESIGYTMSEVMCFGDDYNDLGLFRTCGISVAMGNAVKELIDTATEVTETNDRDGVALVLERVLDTYKIRGH
ncbi:MULTISPECIES: Cof-type HAD-IIB family hydrolase [Paenibacillus]|uniref:Cof-type HAD-IIB family hydrolase n=1 Tax=Paenibacillus TaxID=44249 RepID=UPI0022B93DE5|nr:Cof-type HAD-IIB family hydrolase [Paenibacillus caseinilyticus]MCZ8518530.1 Cof-type HAD-IIB family hydrolase [Paenibacillus caseinilyticus]